MLTRAGDDPVQANYPIDETIRRPVALSRVVERVESLLHERTLRNGALLRFGELTLDAVNERATFGALEIPLGHTETRLLSFFIRQPGKVSAHCCTVWPPGWHTHVSVPRLSLAVGCAYIQTSRSGYRFSAF